MAGKPGTAGARSKRESKESLPRPSKAACNNSLPSITGAIRHRRKAARSNTESNMCPGRLGQALGLNLREIPPTCTEKNFLEFCESHPTQPLWQTAHP